MKHSFRQNLQDYQDLFWTRIFYPDHPVDPVDLLNYQPSPIPPTDYTIKAKLGP
jgi:hypothetical protein